VCLQIGVAFFQIILTFDTTYSVSLPEYFTQWTSVLRVVHLNWLTIFLPGNCIGFSNRLLMTALAPFAMIGLAFVLYTLRAGFNSASSEAPGAHMHQTVAYTMSVGLLSTTPLALLITFAFAPSISVDVFQAWSCEAFGYSATEERYYLRQDLSIRCYSSAAHDHVRSVAYPLIVLWPVGILVLYVALLAMARGPILNRTPNRLVRSIAFLHRDYQSDFYYWEVVELTRRTTLVGWVLLVDESSAFVRLIVAMLVSLAALVLTVSKKPYRYPEE
jgi:hypothetical protein